MTLLTLSLFSVQAFAAAYLPECRVAFYESGSKVELIYKVHQDDFSGPPLPKILGARSDREIAKQPYLVLPLAQNPSVKYESHIRSSTYENEGTTMQVFFRREDQFGATVLHVRLQRPPQQNIWSVTFNEADDKKYELLNRTVERIAQTDGYLPIVYSGKKLNVSWNCRTP